MNLFGNKIPRLLLIEDDMNLNHLFSDILSKRNYEVSYATTLRAAREAVELSRTGYDIVLLDYHLPDGKGDQFISWMRDIAPAVPIVMLSADPDNTIIVKCFKAGAVDYIVKPFDIMNVINILNQTLIGSGTGGNRNFSTEVFTDDWVELSAVSEIDYLTRIQKLCSALLGSRLDKSVVADIRLAMEEYGRNAIEWGNKFDNSKIFRISYCLFKDRIVLKFEDEGEGFDLKAIPDPSADPANHLASRQKSGKRPGGYGIFMMKNIMDDVIYSEKGNVCVMTKYIPEAE